MYICVCVKRSSVILNFLVRPERKIQNSAPPLPTKIKNSGGGGGGEGGVK